MQAQPPRHRPYDKHLREQVVHLYCVSGVKCSAIARWFSGRPGLQGASCSPRAPGLEGFSPLPQKAWCGGCPAAGVYCAGHAGLTHACIAHPLPCLHAHPWQGRPGRTPSCLHSGHPLSCSIHCLVSIALQRLCCHCPCSATSQYHARRPTCKPLPGRWPGAWVKSGPHLMWAGLRRSWDLWGRR